MGHTHAIVKLLGLASLTAATIFLLDKYSTPIEDRITPLHQKVLQVQSYREQGRIKTANTLAEYVGREVSEALGRRESLSGLQMAQYKSIRTSLDQALKTEPTNNISRVGLVDTQ